MRSLPVLLCCLVAAPLAPHAWAQNPPASQARGAPAPCAYTEFITEPPELVGGLEELQSRVEYPEAAHAAGVEGRVIVQLSVGVDGEVIDPVVMRSPDDRLSEAALAAVRASTFEPARGTSGRAVCTKFALPVTFWL